MSADNTDQRPARTPVQPLADRAAPQGDPGSIESGAKAVPAGASPDGGMPGPGETSPDGGMTDIIDIRPLQPPGFDIASLAPAGIGLLAALLLIGGFLLFHHRKRRLRARVSLELPPEQTALAALREISDPGLLDGKVFYYRLSAVLRRYIEQRFGIPALEMTVEEMGPVLDQLTADRDLIRKVRAMFADMAPILYADQGARDARMEEHLALSMNFVEATVPAAEAESAHH